MDQNFSQPRGTGSLGDSDSGSQRLTGVEWLVCIIASIGFAFDIYELLMLPLILRPALESFGVQFGSAEYTHWARLLFFVPAFFGGIIGLLGGYLTDLLGRRRVLTWSILLYAFSAFGAGFSTSLTMLLILRCTTFVGVCVEFVAAVAWLAELFRDPKQREQVLGYTQAFSSLGGILVTAAYALVLAVREYLPAIYGEHEAWRYTLISGVIPALPLIIIRPFLPESPAWMKKKAEGTLKRPSFAELFRPQYRKTTLITALMFACSYGVAFGAIQHLPQIVPGLPELADYSPIERQEVVSQVQFVQELGGLTGRFLLAYLAVIIISRRRLLAVFQLPGLIIVPWVFFYPAVSDLTMLQVGIFLAGLVTVAQFSFWGNYLPRVYPIHLRGTGESFAANVGGRILGTAFALVTLTIAGSEWLERAMPATSSATRFAYTAAGVALFVYAAGNALRFFLPEPKHGELPE
jgi:Na+/melibiose symporter-like transporter